ncbi:MAG: SagB/ThcOx family dehydrogenase [Chloroflexi bacterium]|nr:SagB/ThcOx family dehydrogenase [Chloroflexota bacterium]
MLGKRFDLAVLLILLLAFAVTATTGLLADYLGIPRSLYHRLSAYSLAALALWHVVVRRQQLRGRIKAALGRRERSGHRYLPDSAMPASQLRRSALSRRSFLISGVTGIAGFFLGRWFVQGGLPAELEGADLGLAYHEWSKPSVTAFLRKPLQWGLQPPQYKDYPSAPRMPLPAITDYKGLPFGETVQRRRSLREYAGKPLTLEQLSVLLHSAYGITERTYPLRASPSAGGLYPLEIYPVVNEVTGLSSGVYHYQPKDHALDLIKEGDHRSSLLGGTGGQDMVLKAGVLFVITAIFQRTRWKYQDRAYRYILLDAGHLGENLYLAATSLGLGPCGIGAFFDEEMNRIVGVDGKEESTVYLISVGNLV